MPTDHKNRRWMLEKTEMFEDLLQEVNANGIHIHLRVDFDMPCLVSLYGFVYFAINITHTEPTTNRSISFSFTRTVHHDLSQ